MPKVLIALCLAASAALAQEARVTRLMTHELATADGQEGTLVVVEYPPGRSSSSHRHNAYAFVYVLAPITVPAD